MLDTAAAAIAPAEILAATRALQDVSSLLYEHGWAFGTSGNYSVVLSRSPLRILVTASGRDKRKLTDTDFVLIDERGRPVEPAAPKPSAEALLHVELGQRAGVGAILHTHSVWNTILSDIHGGRGMLGIAGYEVLKGLAGIVTHDTAVEIPIFENTQDIPALAVRVREFMDDLSRAPMHAFLIRGHGLYTWGRDLAEARRHVEILEFLFEVVGRRTELAAAMRLAVERRTIPQEIA